jgi:repressor LexA
MKQRDIEYLKKLRDYYAQHRVLPSYKVVAGLIGLKTTSAVSVFVDRMKTAGLLAAGEDRRLQPGKRFFEREIINTVRAGPAEPASDVEPEALNIDAYLVKNPSRTLLFTVRGDSMIEAGLLPGDTVIVEKNAPCSPGDIVVAEVDGEFTVKYLAKDRDGYYLQPGNPAYSAIRASLSLEIVGRVTGSFRKFPT